MAAWSIFTVTIGFYLYAAVDCKSILEIDGDEDTFEPLCSRKCQKSPEESDNGAFYQYPCSCSKSCAVFGDCCYDSPYKSTESGKHFDFVCLSIVGRGGFQAVSSCPSDKFSDFCKRSLGHQRPVTSRVTNITYGNIFCASCNGDDENLISWNVELRCSPPIGKDVSSSSNQATKLIYRSDEFWKINEKDQTKTICKFHVHFEDFSVLDGLELRPCTNTKKISACSASWRDLAVAEKCKSYEDPVYFHNTAFKNSHCAECNYLDLAYSDCIPFRVKNMLEMELVDPSIIDFCKNRGSDACVISLLEHGKDKPYSYSKLLNVNEEECLPPEGRRCCEGERYNLIIGRCRKIVQE